ECPFWSAVRPRVEAGGSLDRFAAEEHRFDRWPALPRWWLGHRRPSRSVLSYTAHLEALVRGIAAESGRRVVIDSSKVLSRALAYDRLHAETFDVRFIHLVRDGRDVLASRTHRRARTAVDPAAVDPRLDAIRYSALWTAANLLIVALLGRKPGRYLRLRYEDFVRDPATALNRIGAFLALDYAPVARRAEAREPIAIGHIVAGNRMRRDGVVALRRTADSPRDRLRPSERRTYAWIAGSVARVFGYR
ncbi:sulfotransferase domain-containing protein, partial [mine drainage metagenome]